MPDLKDILKQIAKTETTAELRDYWLDQYVVIVEKEIIIFDTSTINFFGTENIAKPVTPIASINLEKLINNGIVDEVLMQQNVEVAVRMLDSSLDVFKFIPEVSSLVEQFRKIGIKLINFEKYLGDESLISYKEKFENLGSAFSNACYRSSESLAEEKGVCLDWDNLKFQLRPKPFEYWYNMETGEIHNGLEVYEDYTPQTVRNSPFEVVPRRNSHIIILPNNPEWSIWSDREVNNIDVKFDVETQVHSNLAPNSSINNIQIDEVPSSDPSLRSTSNIHPETIPFNQVLPNIMDSMNQRIQSKQVIKNSFNLGNEILDSKVSFESNPILNDGNEMNDDESKMFLKSMNLENNRVEKPDLDAVKTGHELIPLEMVKTLAISEIPLTSEVSNRREIGLEVKSEKKKEIKEIKPLNPKLAQINKITENQSHIIKNINNYSMSQYTIALQQIVSLNNLGSFLINANYDADGLKMLTYQGGELSSENDKLVRSYLGLINMSLSKGLTPTEISEEIVEELDDDSNIVMQMVNMLGSVLKTLPVNISQVNSNSLKSLDLITVRRAAKTKTNVLES